MNDNEINELEKFEDYNYLVGAIHYDKEWQLLSKFMNIYMNRSIS